MKDFLSWFGLKPTLHETKEPPYFKERELWWTYVGVNIGFEQDGHGEKSLRPVLVLIKFSKNLFVGIPQTSQKKKEHMPYYYVYTRNGKTLTLLLLQVRVFSSKRLHEKLGVLAKEDFAAVKKRIKDWL